MEVKSKIKIFVTKEFLAPAERVFDCWLDPNMIGQWMFGPNLRNEEVIHIKVDPKQGGEFSFLVLRDGQKLNHVGSYLEMVRPGRLSFSWALKEDLNPSRVEIDITPKQGRSLLHLTHEIDGELSEFESKVKQAWMQMTDMLAKLIN